MLKGHCQINQKFIVSAHLRINIYTHTSFSRTYSKFSYELRHAHLVTIGLQNKHVRRAVKWWSGCDYRPTVEHNTGIICKEGQGIHVVAIVVEVQCVSNAFTLVIIPRFM